MPRFGGAPKCHACDKSVYMAEECNALGKKWHKTCFKCAGCNKRLESGQEAEHDDKPWCKNCYGKRFGPKGVGGGATAGCLAADDSKTSTSKFKNTNTSKKVVTTSQEKCVRCEKTVYAAEKAVVLNKIFHQACVKCAACSKTLDVGAVLEHENEIYCQNCYNKQFAPKGVGFGMSGATLSSGQYADLTK